MRIHDLTRLLSPDTPVYPGDPSVRFSTWADYPHHGFRVTDFNLGTHAGTHLDAPAHFLPGGTTVEQLPLEALVGPASVVDLSAGVPPLRPGDRLLLRTGWGSRWGQPGYFEAFPGVLRTWAEQFSEAPIALLGLDTPSLHPDPDEDAILHRMLLGAGVIVLENLAGLENLPPAVFLAALPLPLQGLDGAPCRVVAFEMFQETRERAQVIG